VTLGYGVVGIGAGIGRVTDPAILLTFASIAWIGLLHGLPLWVLIRRWPAAR
jgi:hypothetical protein